MSKAQIEAREKAGEKLRGEQSSNDIKMSEALDKVAGEVGGTVTSVALAWCMQKTPYVFRELVRFSPKENVDAKSLTGALHLTAIIGGRKVEHLMDNIKGKDDTATRSSSDADIKLPHCSPLAQPERCPDQGAGGSCWLYANLPDQHDPGRPALAASRWKCHHFGHLQPVPMGAGVFADQALSGPLQQQVKDAWDESTNRCMRLPVGRLLVQFYLVCSIFGATSALAGFACSEGTSAEMMLSMYSQAAFVVSPSSLHFASSSRIAGLKHHAAILSLAGRPIPILSRWNFSLSSFLMMSRTPLCPFAGPPKWALCVPGAMDSSSHTTSSRCMRMRSGHRLRSCWAVPPERFISRSLCTAEGSRRICISEKTVVLRWHAHTFTKTMLGGRSKTVSAPGTVRDREAVDTVEVFALSDPCSSKGEAVVPSCFAA